LPVRAQNYPDKPVTLINPYPAGTAADVTSRQFASEFAKVLKQPVVVMNKGGAGGLIGTKFSAMAPPDGYTVGIGAIGTHVFNPAINKATNYDPVKDFEPVSRFVSFPNVLVVPSSLGVSTVAEFVALGKSRRRPSPSSTARAAMARPRTSQQRRLNSSPRSSARPSTTRGR
jgi:tripartite-type tricarboxylate transporter receptor subunit TctC